ncbi:Epsin-3, clathrin recruitment and traffic between the Golgi and endosome [Cryptotrichosporon argae]
MDYVESLAKQASQITMYDIKSYYNQAKNMVLNIPEMEAKVREATNEDPWGASSTLMQEISAGTHNFQHFNEIMPTIYSRFMEKEAREWRQIYKALTLLEYLIKHGSERVVDDARAHVSTIKMLRNFQYIDEKGKDQGINVRNRAQEIAALLSDVDKIRTERRKAKANKNKYQGTGNDGLSFRTASGSRYGGFGSEELGGASASRGYGGEDDYRSRSTYRESTQAADYDEYEGADDFDDRPSSTRRSGPSSSSATPTSYRPSVASPPAPKPVAKEPVKPKEVNLFDFDDEPVSAPAAAPAPVPAAADVMGDDDFADFQEAPVAAPAAAAPKPAAGNANLFALLESSKPSTPAATSYAAPPALAPAFSPPRPQYSSPATSFAPSVPSLSSPALASPALPAAPAKQPAKSTFDDLWTSSLSGLTIAGTSTPGAAAGGSRGGKTIAQMEQEKTMNKLWGAPAASSASSAQPAQAKPAQPSGGFDDLLM